MFKHEDSESEYSEEHRVPSQKWSFTATNFPFRFYHLAHRQAEDGSKAHQLRSGMAVQH